MMSKRFAQKRIWITGASAGIGAALAIEFARQGGRLALSSRRPEWLEKTAQAVQAVGGQSLVAVCDVTRRETLDQAVNQIIAAWGGLDIAIANAGFGVSGLFSELTVEDYRRQLETNFFGVLHTLYAALPHLQVSHGQVVVISSIAGRIGFPTSSAYCASKFALVGLCESLSYELAGEGIAVTTINPGIVESDIARVDNQGVFHETWRDPRPASLIVPTAKAARQMVNCIYRRKPEAIITGHGKIAVWLNRYFPWFLRLYVRRSSRGKLETLKKRKRGQEPSPPT